MSEEKKCSDCFPLWLQITCAAITLFCLVTGFAFALVETANFFMNVNRAVEKINKE